MTTNYKAARAARLKMAEAILARMKARHPAAFPFPPRPLKVGIRDDLIAAGWTEEEVIAALGYYLKTRPYLQCTFAEGQYRIDLSGFPISPVEQHEATWARERVRTGDFHGSGSTR